MHAYITTHPRSTLLALRSAVVTLFLVFNVTSVNYLHNQRAFSDSCLRIIASV